MKSNGMSDIEYLDAITGNMNAAQEAMMLISRKGRPLDRKMIDYIMTIVESKTTDACLQEQWDVSITGGIFQKNNNDKCFEEVEFVMKHLETMGYKVSKLYDLVNNDFAGVLEHVGFNISWRE